MNSLTKHLPLSIVVPFRNEVSLIDSMVTAHKQLQTSQIEFIYVDDGSVDGSGDELRRLSAGVTILRLDGVGTGKAFLAGAKQAGGRYVLLLPIDCGVSSAGIVELLRVSSNEKTEVLLFPKRYARTEAMSWYAFMQNFVLIKIVKLASWTNGFVIHRGLVPALERATKDDFLNDLELSRNLRAKPWRVLSNVISVSARRYENDGTWRRILINGVILVLWRFKLASPRRLWELYKRGKMGSYFLVLWLVSDGFASGNYQRKSYSTPPVRSLGPQARDAKAIEKDVFRWDRQGVAIHGVSANERKFVVTGSYTFRSDFHRFLRKLKGEDTGVLREVTVKESTSSFGGSTSYSFEAEVDNAW
jgi:glycosyltransferase involved in cell wall biosynthesis